jgi:hypothetical protein
VEQFGVAIGAQRRQEELVTTEVVSVDWSFDRVKPFPTGQGSLI